MKTQTPYEITLVDEYNQIVPFKEKFHLVAITINTSNATHCYDISKRFRNKNTKVVMGGTSCNISTRRGKETLRLYNGWRRGTYMARIFRGFLSR
ncbi:hypothetical protein [Clostridium sp. YIM B02551]|uniref:hypothetical protein n=1 Tax=Clostridium sp. YIM B02551 TaxID=2910679 RepID=UPI001EE9C54F|nr:hypothetical protein [Clostridium sp. YIM B02551]